MFVAGPDRRPHVRGGERDERKPKKTEGTPRVTLSDIIDDGSGFGG